MNLSLLIEKLEKVEVIGNTDIEVSGITYDSRKCREGFLFAALRGSNFDGHDYIRQAIDSKVSVILCEALPEDFEQGSATFVKVDNSRKSLAVLSHTFHGDPSTKMKVVGVTGTNGKTTTTFLLKSIYEKAGYKCGLIGTTGILIGNDFTPATHTTPESLELVGLFSEMLQKEVSVVLMEVSSHSLHQDRTAGIDFDLALFTNLTADHLDYHNDMYEYATAKKKLFDNLKPEAKAIVFDNSEFSEYVVKDTQAGVYFCGRNEENDFKIESEELSLGNAVFILSTSYKDENRDFVIETSLSGSFNIDNASIAASAAYVDGIEEKTIKDALLNSTGAPGRMQAIKLKHGALALVDYAHTPDALEKALTACREVLNKSKSGGKLICLFGCGGDRDKTKRPIMGNIAAGLADYSIITSDNPRTEEPDKIIAAIYEGIDRDLKFKVVEISNREEAINYAVNFAQENDILLVAGKGHENYQVIGTEKFHFDDAEQIRKFNE